MSLPFSWFLVSIGEISWQIPGNNFYFNIMHTKLMLLPYIKWNSCISTYIANLHYSLCYGGPCKVKPIWYSWLLKEEKSVLANFASLWTSLWHVTNLPVFPPPFFYQCQVVLKRLSVGSVIRRGREGLTRGVNHLQLKSHKNQMNLWLLKPGIFWRQNNLIWIL